MMAHDYVKAKDCMSYMLEQKISNIPSNKPIERIKALRTAMPGLSLLEAKDFIDYFARVECPF